MRRWTIGCALLALAVAEDPFPSIAGDAPAGTFRFAEEVKLVTPDPQQHSGGGISYLRAHLHAEPGILEPERAGSRAPRDLGNPR